MSPIERRNYIVAASNPDTHHDYIVDIKGKIAAPASASSPASITLRYIPDRLVIEPASFGIYLHAIESLTFDTLEAIAATILDDINNELVARWVQITLSSPDSIHPGVQSHDVMLEDRQPGWNNQVLLSRLRPF